MTLRRLWLALAAVVLSMPPAVFAQTQAFTIEQVTSAPFPTDLTAAAKGGKYVWVQDDRGVRNLWVAEAPEYRGRQLTHYAADDGQELGDLSFTPGGGAVVYVRGGAPNRAGEIPNPTSDAAGAEQAVWIVPLAGGEPRLLGPGTGPAVSPRGDQVVFLRRGQVMAAPLAEGEKAVELFKARGTEGSLRWSPDGARLAFTSRRGDHGFIGVYDLAAKTIQDLDPSVDRDQSPVWSPDGRSIAFVRVPVNKSALPFIPEREGEPWSIRFVDLGTGGAGARRCGGPSPGRAASSTASWPRIRSSGRPTAGSSFRGSAPVGCTCTQCLPRVVPRSSSRPATSRSSTSRSRPAAGSSSTPRTRATSTGGISGGWAWRAVRRRR